MSDQVRRVWLGFGVALMALVTWVNDQSFAVGLIPPPWDKGAHFLVFLALAGSLGFGLGRGRVRLVLLLVIGFAGFDELRQLHLPGRSADWGDFWVDVSAALLGVAVLCSLPTSRGGVHR